jgi:hypothetical protein
MPKGVLFHGLSAKQLLLANHPARCNRFIIARELIKINS